MATIAPFRGIRYSFKSPKELASVICPPYDVISAVKQRELASRHAVNVVRLELPLDNGTNDRYLSAARHLNHWRQEGFLIPDKEPAFYLYSQEYSLPDGSRMNRRGFFAALKLEEPRKGSVLPHEKTLPKPKEERLKLMHALHADVSPIFGLFSDPKSEAQKLIRMAMRKKPLQEAWDEDNVYHRLWALTQEKAVQKLVQLLKSKKVFIADGHHRYETSWAYRQELQAQGNCPASADYVMCFLCPMEDPGLVVLPTHRVLKPGIPVPAEKIKKYFDMEPAPDLKTLLARMENQKQDHVFGLSQPQGFWLLRLKDLKDVKSKLPAKPRAYQTLDVVILHTLLLDHITTDQILFVKDAQEAADMVERGEGSAAFFLNATEVSQVKAVSLAGEVMPQKSTYFTPKLATGFVLMSLEDKL